LLAAAGAEAQNRRIEANFDAIVINNLLMYSAGMKPSPLNLASEKILAVSAVSSTVIALASGFPRFVRISLAELMSRVPSGNWSLMMESGNSGRPLVRSSGFRSRDPVHFTAAMIFGTRTRPSPSLSISSRV